MKNTKQAVAPKTIPFGVEAFKEISHTELRWLGNSGGFINSRGTTLMIDPLLIDFDMPLLIDLPIHPKDVPNLDAVLITHCDNDHFDRNTCSSLSLVCQSYHAPYYVASLLEKENIKAEGHDIHDAFSVGEVNITLTPADHAWQNEKEKYRKLREYKFEDYCGFWIETKDGTIWVVGDSRLLPEQLTMPAPDVMFFDFSDNSWHIGFENAVKLANTYPNTDLILYHWGSVDAPDMDAFNGDPVVFKSAIINPERAKVLAPGESYILKRNVK